VWQRRLTLLVLDSPTSNPAPDAEFINQLGSALQDLKTVLQTVTGSVFKYQRREKRLRPVQASNLRGVTMANSAVPIAVSWKLDCPSVEALLDKNPRTVVPPEEIVTGRPQHGMSPDSTHIHTPF
jgi:hypothetical protein